MRIQNSSLPPSPRIWGARKTRVDKLGFIGSKGNCGRFLFGFMVMIIVQQAIAGGLQINEQSATAISMGGAYVAIANNPSAVYFNPAGLPFQKGTRFLLGTTVVVSHPRFRQLRSTDETRMESAVFFPSYFYVTHTLESGLGLGFGVYNPFGLKTEWPDSWVGQFLATKGDVKTFYLNPTVSYRIGSTFAVAAGLDYMLGSVKLQRSVDLLPVAEDGRLNMEGDGNALAANVGVLFRPSARWSFGAAWRGKSTLDIEGMATFNGIPPSLEADFPAGDVLSSLRMPDNVSIGVAYSPNDAWMFAVDYQWVRWSVAESLTFDFKTETLRQQDLVVVGQWNDGRIIRIGGEHRLSSIWKVRAGYFFESVPSVDEYLTPLVPEADRMGFSVGIGYKVSRDLYIDVAYLYVRSDERTVTNSKLESPPGTFFNGTYNSSASIAALNLGYNL